MEITVTKFPTYIGRTINIEIYLKILEYVQRITGLRSNWSAGSLENCQEPKIFIESVKTVFASLKFILEVETPVYHRYYDDDSFVEWSPVPKWYALTEKRSS